jgi:hypothetical protein
MITRTTVPKSIVHMKMVAFSSRSGRGGVIPNVMMKLWVTCLNGLNIEATTFYVLCRMALSGRFLLNMLCSCDKEVAFSGGPPRRRATMTGPDVFRELHRP